MILDLTTVVSQSAVTKTQTNLGKILLGPKHASLLKRMDELSRNKLLNTQDTIDPILLYLKSADEEHVTKLMETKTGRSLGASIRALGQVTNLASLLKAIPKIKPTATITKLLNGEASTPAATTPSPKPSPKPTAAPAAGGVEQFDRYRSKFNRRLNAAIRKSLLAIGAPAEIGVTINRDGEPFVVLGVSKEDPAKVVLGNVGTGRVRTVTARTIAGKFTGTGGTNGTTRPVATVAPLDDAVNENTMNIRPRKPRLNVATYKALNTYINKANESGFGPDVVRALEKLAGVRSDGTEKRGTGQIVTLDQDNAIMYRKAIKFAPVYISETKQLNTMALKGKGRFTVAIQIPKRGEPMDEVTRNRIVQLGQFKTFKEALGVFLGAVANPKTLAEVRTAIK